MTSNLNEPSQQSLPPAAQRWLDSALSQAVDLPETIQIEQEGSMNVRDRWTPFTASGSYKAAPLSFSWQAPCRQNARPRLITEY